MDGPTRPVAAFVLACTLCAAGPAAAQTSLPRVLGLEDSLRGAEEQELRWPVATAAASADEFAVADAFVPRIFLFRSAGASWELAHVAALPAAPVALAHDGRRYVASLRGGQGLLALEGPQLLQRRIGLPRGVVPGPLAARSDGGLLIYDYAGGKVVELNAEGNPAGEVEVAGRVTALAAAPGGGFYAAVGDEAVILRYRPDGPRGTTWHLPGDGPVPAWPAGLAAEPGGGLAVVDRHVGRILVLDDGGRPVGSGARRGWEPGLLLYPSSITRLPDGRLLVADEGNGRAQLFRRMER